MSPYSPKNTGIDSTENLAWVRNLEPSEVALVAAALAIDGNHPNAAIPGRNLLVLVAKLADMLTEREKVEKEREQGA